jgi:hypothetical protein
MAETAGCAPELSSRWEVCAPTVGGKLRKSTAAVKKAATTRCKVWNFINHLLTALVTESL